MRAHRDRHQQRVRPRDVRVVRRVVQRLGRVLRGLHVHRGSMCVPGGNGTVSERDRRADDLHGHLERSRQLRDVRAPVQHVARRHRPTRHRSVRRRIVRLPAGRAAVFRNGVLRSLVRPHELWQLLQLLLGRSTLRRGRMHVSVELHSLRCESMRRSHDRSAELRFMRSPLPHRTNVLRRRVLMPFHTNDVRNDVRRSAERPRQLWCVWQRVRHGVRVRRRSMRVPVDVDRVRNELPQPEHRSEQLRIVWSRVRHERLVVCGGNLFVQLAEHRVSEWRVREHQHQRGELRRVWQRMRQRLHVLERRVHVFEHGVRHGVRIDEHRRDELRNVRRRVRRRADLFGRRLHLSDLSEVCATDLSEPFTTRVMTLARVP